MRFFNSYDILVQLKEWDYTQFYDLSGFDNTSAKQFKFSGIQTILFWCKVWRTHWCYGFLVNFMDVLKTNTLHLIALRLLWNTNALAFSYGSIADSCFALHRYGYIWVYSMLHQLFYIKSATSRCCRMLVKSFLCNGLNRSYTEGLQSLQQCQLILALQKGRNS